MTFGHSLSLTISNEHHLKRPTFRVLVRVNHIQRDHHCRDRLVRFRKPVLYLSCAAHDSPRARQLRG